MDIEEILTEFEGDPSDIQSISPGEFDFAHNCIFCGQNAADLFEEQQRRFEKDKRQRVSILQSDDSQVASEIQSQCPRDSDIYLRFARKTELQISARYHRNCYMEHRSVAIDYRSILEFISQTIKQGTLGELFSLSNRRE